MPKLNAEVVQSVEEAESSGGLMEDGVYVMALIEVNDSKEGEPLMGPKGPYWNWTFKVPEDAERYKGWQQWLTTSLSEAAAFKLKEVFEAFGVSPDTDTDTLIGELVRIEVGTRVIQSGPRMGDSVNHVKGVYPLDPNAPKATASATKAGDKPATKKNLF